jgi:DNA ligase-1
MRKLIFLFFIAVAVAKICLADQSHQPAIQLANIYHQNIDVTNYLVSEKLDGLRSYWDGKNLISKEGNIYNAPEWFTKDFPSDHLEGELWVDRGKFEEVSGIVRTQIPNDQDWQKVHLMLFDMPQHQGIFSERLETMKNIVANLHSKNLAKNLLVIEQFKIANHQVLMKKLDEITKKNGEGLVLHRQDSFYKATRSAGRSAPRSAPRSDDVLKLKTFDDAEAKVLSHIAGKGKYEGMMGAMLVENEEKIRFKIGGGFSDELRKNPPKIGSIITYKYFGKTKENKPRFASFLRIREDYKFEYR